MNLQSGQKFTNCWKTKFTNEQNSGKQFAESCGEKVCERQLKCRKLLAENRAGEKARTSEARFFWDLMK